MLKGKVSALTLMKGEWDVREKSNETQYFFNKVL